MSLRTKEKNGFTRESSCRLQHDLCPASAGSIISSAVGDRFGLWGTYGQPHVAWGEFPRFVAYTGQLNWFAPAALVPALAWIATIAEILLGVLLILGLFTRIAAAFGVSGPTERRQLPKVTRKLCSERSSTLRRRLPVLPTFRRYLRVSSSSNPTVRRCRHLRRVG